MHGSSKSRILAKAHSIRILTILAVLMLLLPLAGGAVAAGTLLSATFDAGYDGFSYQDDTFGTSQPNYASGTRVTTGGYGGTGGLQVTLGGVDANAISGMSGGWSYTLNLAAAETGVKLSFRYKLDQTATYEFDEYTRMLVKVDGVQYGRGAEELCGSHRRRRFQHTGQQQYLPADHRLAAARDLPGEPGCGQPHHRPGRLQQQEGRRGRVDHGHDRRRGRHERERGAGGLRRADPRQPGEHQPVPGLQPGRRAVRRPLFGE